MKRTEQPNNRQNIPMSNDERIVDRTNQRRKKIRRKRMIIRGTLGSIMLVVGVLLAIQGLFGRATKADLTAIGGVASAGVSILSSMISNWKKNYTDVRIIDCSASGLFETVSDNLLELL